MNDEQRSRTGRGVSLIVVTSSPDHHQITITRLGPVDLAAATAVYDRMIYWCRETDCPDLIIAPIIALIVRAIARLEGGYSLFDPKAFCGFA